LFAAGNEISSRFDNSDGASFIRQWDMEIKRKWHGKMGRTVRKGKKEASKVGIERSESSVKGEGGVAMPCFSWDYASVNPKSRFATGRL